MSTNYYIYRKHECNCEFCGFDLYDDDPKVHLGRSSFKFSHCMHPDEFDKLPLDTIIIDEYGRKSTMAVIRKITR